MELSRSMRLKSSDGETCSTSRDEPRGGDPDVALEIVMSYIDDPRDRDAVSLVCQRWYQLDALTRKHITIAPCYSTSPDRLRRRFTRLESLKLKGKPRASMFNLIAEDWGGYAGPWINEIADAFTCLKSLHFRRMIVSDDDIGVLVRERGHMLLTLKLDKCSGFSTDSLLQVARTCRILNVLFLEESSITENDGNWLHELAVNNTVLVVLNFYMTELQQISIQDLVLIARNCRSLVSVKTSDCEITELIEFFRAATALEEFGGGSVIEQVGEDSKKALEDKYANLTFPPRLCHLGLTYMGTNEMQYIYPCAARLKKLDLQYALLNTEDHCQLIQRCPNLEILEARDVIGDRGLEVLAQSCRKLRRLRIERGEDEQGLEDVQGIVSHTGLINLARGCPELEYLAVYVSDITNTAFETLGSYSKNLTDFRLVLLDRLSKITDLPLDNGVRALLTGCDKLRRFALYLRPGALTDTGLSYVGHYSNNIRWMLLGYVGETDEGLLRFSEGCHNLQKLEMRGCSFSERAIAKSVLNMSSLRYIWVQGFHSQTHYQGLMEMERPYWNIEVIPPMYVPVEEECGGAEDGLDVVDQPAHLVAYYSLAGQRTDYPPWVLPIHPLPFPRDPVNPS
ncbi:Coronatine-insensitive protein 1 [Acorus calamus]|uniref:Coronatine-insensitive protein 1 n=1 Tax=Acorus calamus TaxID=4465 RepID=A0AAV9F802_ACOCL|nr:Coronatine-insensitive protein 1 [Acorus calamus]